MRLHGIHAGVLLAVALAGTADAAIKDWDVGDYVQDGLIAHYDGIRNAGATAPHDSSAAQWADLAAPGVYATRVDIPASGDFDRGSWTSNAYTFAGWSYMQMSAPVALGGEFTIQIACNVDTDGERTYNTPPYYHTYGTVFGSGEFKMFMTRASAGARAETNLNWKTDTYGRTDTTRPNMPWAGKYVNAAFDSSFLYILQDANWSRYSTNGRKGRTIPDAVPSLTYTIGGGDGNNGGNCTFGDYHAVRIYSRKLTNDELAWNRDVDEVRFRGALPTASNAVYVASNKGGIFGAESGVYRLRGAYTFTAGERTLGDVKYRPNSWVVAAWDAASGKWVDVERGRGGSCTLREAGATAARRLTWRFSAANGLVVIYR